MTPALPALDDAAEHDETISTMIAGVDQLTSREQRVLRLRYGFEDEEERTLDGVGEVLDLSRERVRQLEEQALRKLRETLDQGSEQERKARLMATSDALRSVAKTVKGRTL